MVRKACLEAGQLAEAHYEWVPGGKWQQAMGLYLGNKSRNDYNWWFGGPGQLERKWNMVRLSINDANLPHLENIRCQHDLHFAGWGNPQRFTYGYIYRDSKIEGSNAAGDSTRK